MDERVKSRRLADQRYLQSLHHKSSRSFWQAVGYIALFFVGVGLAIATWYAGYWPVTVALWLLTAHLGHMNLIAFHEASHFTLHPNRVWNESAGIVIGTISFTPLSAYRHVHNEHHVHLGTSKDSELWPFVHPGTPRAARILAAFAELFLGFFYTPVIFIHGVVTAEKLPLKHGRRIAAEYVLCVLAWGAALSAITWLEIWEPFCIGYLVPTILSGNLQSVRKFTEHLGLTGNTILTTTRTVVDDRPIGKLLSESMMHIDYHGPHHRYAKIPHYELPQVTPLVYGEATAAVPVFGSYAAAMWDMAKTLHNPRVGSQWLTAMGEKSAVRGVQRLAPRIGPNVYSGV